MLKKNNTIVGKNIYNSNIYIETFNQNNVKKCNFENCINKIKNINKDKILLKDAHNKIIIMQLLHQLKLLKEQNL